ncbi:MAG: hypothetical protein ACLTJ5_03180 [Clostridium sp.]
MKAIVVLNVTAGSVCDCEGAIDIEGGEDIFTKKKERQKFPIWFLVKKIRCGYGMSGKFPERKMQCSGFCTRMFALGN